MVLSVFVFQNCLTTTSQIFNTVFFFMFFSIFLGVPKVILPVFIYSTYLTPNQNRKDSSYLEFSKLTKAMATAQKAKSFCLTFSRNF